MTVIAQQKPDLSGEWKLSPQASMLSPVVAPAVQSGVLRIEHREPRFNCHLTIVLDGKPIGGLNAGATFSGVGIAFVAVSLFTDVSRPTWVLLDNLKGAIGFGCCGVAGLRTARHTRRASSGAAAGAFGGAIVGVTVPPSVQAYLISAKGHADILSTSVGLVPVVVVFAAALGAAVGFLGGTLGTRTPRRGSVLR